MSLKRQNIFDGRKKKIKNSLHNRRLSDGNPNKASKKRRQSKQGVEKATPTTVGKATEIQTRRRKSDGNPEKASDKRQMLSVA